MRVLPFLLVILLLAACSPGDIATMVNRPTAIPRATTQQALPIPTPSGPRPTAQVLTDSAPVPTLEPELTSAMNAQQRLLVELYRRASPAVVSIEGSGAHPPIDGMDMPDGRLPVSQGSGFLIDQQGHIVTNNHVVEGADSFTVTFADGSIVPAALVGSDEGSDLAVLRVEALPLATAPLRLSQQAAVEVGQTAIAIGNPFGLQNTLTVGVVSGIGRDIRGPSSPNGGSFAIPNIIQTDAAINPGNSGGPLLNIYGEVIGVNTAISTDSGTFEGVGYAVPASSVARVVPELIRVGVYQHVWLGVSMEQITPQLREQLGLSTAQGLLVLNVVPDGPAADAGIRADDLGTNPATATRFSGDIITSIDDQAMVGPNDLRSYLDTKQVGDTVTLTLLRDGAQVTLPLVLEARPSASPAAGR
ncbi:MAG: trypsin-like peptidase domain-containing protein [Roseiflexaceae bacterium]|nr:trypsin-like peptidase domain-containing protein [Roseiflexaceae bacterium]